MCERNTLNLKLDIWNSVFLHIYYNHGNSNNLLSTEFQKHSIPMPDSSLHKSSELQQSSDWLEAMLTKPKNLEY